MFNSLVEAEQLGVDRLVAKTLSQLAICQQVICKYNHTPIII